MSAVPPTVSGAKVRLRPIAVADLPRAAEFVYTLSITEPMIDLTRLTEVHAATGFWLDEQDLNLQPID